MSTMPNLWGEGALFAFSGFDGTTSASSRFVMTLAAHPFDLLIHTPQRRTLHITIPGDDADAVVYWPLQSLPPIAFGSHAEFIRSYCRINGLPVPDLTVVP